MEVAGLVLGALPLILSAIESYDTVAQLSKNYWHYESILHDIRLQVFAQDEQLRRTLKLINLVDPTQQNLEMQLRRRFPEKHENYLDIIRQMDKIAAQMMKKMELDSRGKPAWFNDTSDRARYEWRRVKRSISHMKTWTFAEQLQYWNNVLTNCFQTPEVGITSTKETPTLSTVKNGFDIDRCDKTRQNARSVFRAVQGAWKCKDVAHCHQGNLKLSWHEHDQPQIDILPIAITPGQSQPKSPLVWHSFVVEVHDGEVIASSSATTSTSSQHVNTETPVSTKKSHSISRRLQSVFRRKVPSTPSATLAVAGLERPLSAYREIGSLCSLIDETASDSRFVLGMAENKSRIIIKHDRLDSPQEVPMELKSLLSSSKRLRSSRGHIPRASLSERLAVSAGLCWGVLYLAETPWLAPDWEWIDDISIFKKPSIDNYVSQLPAIGWLGNNDRSAADGGIQTFHIQRGINKTLFALGVLLIELCLDTSFQSLRSTSLSQRAANSAVPDDIEIADELVQRVYDSVGRGYGYAAQRCIHGDFPGRRDMHDFNLQSFRLDFFNEVVAPVQATYKYFAP
ncbi:hypothetical protein PFICI_03828 [Pestalotiopsis fici W106-1]|uniref:DUF7580 domain-containing protein n=1 Tax=Pestalotiopsis fici (strain W106-1 / CGMCC3.15140) TaxID=1229662 RepID=W3XIB3_PESFW|nr:uncharacterized protein PFICI_03828 [Pestalotiopsis fici W106-1]ETS85803.1 hypothetical protein PFICI_03828 [Pestalotiopsis fici W106-1]